MYSVYRQLLVIIPTGTLFDIVDK